MSPETSISIWDWGMLFEKPDSASCTGAMKMIIKTTATALIVFALFTFPFRTGVVLADGDAGEADRFALNIAVVDVREVMRNSSEWARFQREHQTMREEAEEILRGYQNRMTVLEMEYESLTPGSERAGEKGREIQALVGEFRQREEELSRQYRLHGMEGFRKFYKALDGVIAAYAEENEIDIVLKRQHVDLSVSEIEELEIFESAAVLFAAPDLDISADIIRAFNELFSEESEP